MKRNLLVVGLVAVLGIAGGMYAGLKTREPASPPVSPANVLSTNALFTLPLEDVKGEVHSLKKWQSRVLLINFWAPWCAPCVEEMPALSQLQRTLQSRDIHIIGIGIDSKENIVQFASQHQIRFPLYIGGMNAVEISRKMGNANGGLPFTVLVGKDGQIKKTYLGRLDIPEVQKDLSAL